MSDSSDGPVLDGPSGGLVEPTVVDGMVNGYHGWHRLRVATVAAEYGVPPEGTPS